MLDLALHHLHVESDAAEHLEHGAAEVAGGAGALRGGLVEEAADQGEVGLGQRGLGRGVGGLPGGELGAQGAEQVADGLVRGDALAHPRLGLDQGGGLLGAEPVEVALGQHPLAGEALQLVAVAGGAGAQHLAGQLHPGEVVAQGGLGRRRLGDRLGPGLLGQRHLGDVVVGAAGELGVRGDELLLAALDGVEVGELFGEDGVEGVLHDEDVAHPAIVAAGTGPRSGFMRMNRSCHQSTKRRGTRDDTAQSTS